MEQDAAARQQMVQKDELKAIAMQPKPSTGTSFPLPLQADIDTSPYTSPLITLHFADGPPLSVHKRLIDKSPKLSSGCRHVMTLHLAHIPSGAGHVLVHYLFTGMYECLKPRGTSCNVNNAAEFATGVRVRDVARDYELPELEILAVIEIEKLGNRLQVMQNFDVLKDTLPDELFEEVIEAFEKTDPLSSSLNNFSAIQDRHDRPVVAHVETRPSINLEHKPTKVFESAPDHEGLDMTSKRRKGERKRNKNKRKEAGSSSAAFAATSTMATCNQKAALNSKARRRLKRLQRFSTANNHPQSESNLIPKENDLESMSRLEPQSDDGFGTSSA
ncbi:hypothetical protein F4823DRAFT_639837 [Ustulina deusta]|nr:hypothetical protein F4823DRAFT_639837 [Ustulina deusta]